MARSYHSSTWRYAGFGLELGLLIGGSTYLGHLADRHFGTEPWLMLTAVLLAMGGGCYTLARQVFAESKRKPPNRDRPR